MDVLVPVKGGRWHIIAQLAVYTTYIPLIYCLLGGYMLPITFYGNQKQPLICWWKHFCFFSEYTKKTSAEKNIEVSVPQNGWQPRCLHDER